MLGFTQNSQFTGSLMLGFSIQSDFNVLIRVIDNQGNNLENSLVIFNGMESFTNNDGFVEFEATAGAYTFSATNGGYSTFEGSGNYVEGILELVATLTLTPQRFYPFLAETGTLLWSPVLNSLKFVNSNDSGFLDYESLEDIKSKGWMWWAGYCQKVQIGESRTIQVHTNGTTPTFYLKDYQTDAILVAIPMTSVGSSSKKGSLGEDIPFDFYECTVGFSQQGYSYGEIEINSGAISIKTEPIIVGNFPDYVKFEFENYKNTTLNVWQNNDFQLRFTILVEAQLYRRKTASERTVFLDSNNNGQVLSQRNRRGMMLNVFQLPPYMHEMLAYGFSLNEIWIDGQPFYSEAGYQDPEYIDRFTLSNSSVDLFTSGGYKQNFGRPPSPTAPSLLAAKTLSQIDVLVAWTLGENAVTLELERSLTGLEGEWTLIATLGITEQSYIDTGLSEGTVYFYRIRATGSPNSDYSNVDSVLTLVDFGLAIDYSDSDNVIEIGSQLNTEISTQNYAMWVKSTIPDPVGGTTLLLLDSRDSSPDIIQLWYRTANLAGTSNRLTIGFDGAGFTSKPLDGTNLMDGEWHRIIYRFTDEGVNWGLRFFIDGVAFEEERASVGSNYLIPKSSIVDPNFYSDTKIGFSQGFSWIGALDNINIFKGNFTDAEAIEDYNGDKGSKVFQNNYPSAVMYDMETPTAEAGEDNTGLTTITDQSGNGRDGTLTNFTLTGPTSNYVDSVDNSIDILTATPLTNSDILLTWDSTGLVGNLVVIVDDNPDFSTPLYVLIRDVKDESIIVSGLTPNTLYYFENSLQGMNSTFKTLESYPLVDFGLAIDSDGVNDAITIAGINGLAIPKDIAFQAWVNFKGIEDRESPEVLFTSFQTNNFIQIRLGSAEVGIYPPTGKRFITLFMESSGVTPLIQTVEIDLDSDWHLVTVAMIQKPDLLNSISTISMDGVLLTTSGDVLDEFYFPDTWVNPQLFNSIANAGANASIDNFIIYNQAYTHADHLEEWNNGKGSKAHESKTRLIDYDFNKAGATAGVDNTLVTDVTIVDDQSGNGYDGTLTNFALTGETSNYVDSVENGIDILTATATSPTAIQLDWDYSIVGLPQIASIIEHDTDPDFGAPTVVNISEGLSSTLINGLVTATKYYFRIQGDTMTGWFKSVEETTL